MDDTRYAQKIKEYLIDVPCNLCGATSAAVVYKARYDFDDPAEEVLSRFRSHGGDMLFDQVVRCKHCGLVFVSPRMGEDVILNEYSSANIHGYREQFVSQNEGRERAFERFIKPLNKRCPAKGRLLDVGTAGGTFPAIAQKYGWEVYGCEPNRWFCTWAKENYGLHIDCGTLFEQQYKNEYFDVITLFDVIEHVPDPASLLDKCNRLLKPGGLLVVTYPDIGSWIARIMGRRWVFLMSVHLYYFTRRTASAMLDKTGFTVKNISPHIQTLRLGYIVYRLQTYSMFLHKAGTLFADIFHAGNLMAPYWVGINCITAQKSRSVHD